MNNREPRYTRLNESHREEVIAFLRAHLTTSMFLVSNLNAAGFAYAGERFQGVWCGAWRGQELVGVASHAWNGNIIIQCPETDPAALIHATLASSKRALGGLIGPWNQLELVMNTFEIDPSSCGYSNREPLFTLALDELELPAQLSAPNISYRCATADDLDAALAWRIDYDTELFGSADPERSGAAIESLIQKQELWLLTYRDAPVSMTGLNASAFDTVQIGGVWTPVAHRRRGYARAAVAAQLLDCKARGFRRAILFTGEDNIAAQRAYEALGFERSGSYGLVLNIPAKKEAP